MRKHIFASILVVGAACHHDNSGGADSSVDTKPADSSNGPATITLTLTNHPTNAAMFSFVAAYQDGSGPWTLAPAPSGDVYTFTVTSAAYSVAWTCVPAAGLRTVTVLSFAVSERTSITQVIPQQCTDHVPPTPVGLAGAVANPPVGTLKVAFGHRPEVDAMRVGGAGATTYTMETPPSTHDLIAGHNSAVGALGNTDINTDTALVQRALVVSAMTTANIDYANAAATTSFAVTGPTPSSSTITTVSTDLVSAGNTNFKLVHLTSGAGSPTFVTRGLNAGQVTTGDLYNQQIQVSDTSGSGSSATVQNWTDTIAAQTYVAPAPFGTPTATVSAQTPYPIITTTWSAYTSAIGYLWSASQLQTALQCGGANPCAVVWLAFASPGSVGGSPQTQMPDLSALTGWDPKLQLVTGTSVKGTTSAFVSSVGAMDFPDFPTPASGTTRSSATSNWSVTP